MWWLKEQDFKMTSCQETFSNMNERSSRLCEGYLYLQGHRLWRFPNHLWNRKYFTLKNDCLYFTKEKGELTFEDAKNKIEIEADTGIYPEESTKGKERYFIRITQGKQQYVLCSGKENDRNIWLASLLTVITQKFINNFKSEYYKSIPLNYRTRQNKIQKQKRLRSKSDDDRKHEFSIKLKTGSLLLTKPESLFNLTTAPKEMAYRDKFIGAN